MKKKSFKNKFSRYNLSEVVSVVSHQLKTPLSALKGYLETLLSEDLGKLTLEQKDYLKDALENTIRMIGLVKDFLDVSRIEQNRMEFKLQLSSLEEIVKEVVKEFSLLAKAKNCILYFKTQEKMPLLNIDPLKIKQVVNNIISNAIQYNKRRGRVQIEIKRRGSQAVFCCKDSGVGISAKERKRIFTKFYRSDEAVNLTAGGSGLGLFISKAIIKKSGGKIWFKSKKGQGSTFCFFLPIKNYGKRKNSNY